MFFTKSARRWVAGLFFGRVRFQRIFERLEIFALAGMNFGRGGDLHHSGETFVLKYIQAREKNKSLVIFDVGSNIGEYTKCLAKQFPTSQIYAFEPSVYTYNLLLKNLTGIDPSIQTYNLGFGDTAGQFNLYAEAEGSGLSSLYNRRLDHFGLSISQSQAVQIETLDAFCDRQNIDHIDFLKLDVEGNEFNVLHGASNLLMKGSVRYVQFEFGGCDIDSRTFFQDFWYLFKKQYDIYRIVKDGLYPITEYRERDERFLNINYLAIKKN